ncbi:hypothetical protein F5Y18DRAFT_394693 [Xylariaceae sp. FL1019]|nr:hypothetical protein F5Y18DRAFT_394693 [Xylariaceae sp. FL1019]
MACEFKAVLYIHVTLTHGRSQEYMYTGLGLLCNLCRLFVSFAPKAVGQETGIAVFLTRNAHIDLGLVLLGSNSHMAVGYPFVSKPRELGHHHRQNSYLCHWTVALMLSGSRFIR